MAHLELGNQLLQRIQVDIENFAKIELYPKIEGRVMVMVIAPK